MGMYTELYLSCELKEETPEQVLSILKYMLSSDENDATPPLPPHDLFGKDRWRFMLRCSSFYFVPMATSQLYQAQGRYYLTVRCDLKNYEGEIEAFIDWLTPWIEAYPNSHLGHMRYEEEQVPTLLFHPNKWVTPVIAAKQVEAGEVIEIADTYTLPEGAWHV